MRTALIACLALIIGCDSSAGAVENQKIRVNAAGVAIDGYSPVSYFQRGRAESGVAEFSATFDGVTYWFTDAEQVRLFEQDPARFAPAHGGWCSLMLGGSGNRAVANPASFRIVDDQLLLFWASDLAGELGLRNWRSKTNEDPERERRWLEKANETWEKILSGRKNSQIHLFDPADAERISEEQAALAKRKY